MNRFLFAKKETSKCGSYYPRADVENPPRLWFSFSFFFFDKTNTINPLRVRACVMYFVKFGLGQHDIRFELYLLIKYR